MKSIKLMCFELSSKLYVLSGRNKKTSLKIGKIGICD